MATLHLLWYCRSQNKKKTLLHRILAELCFWHSLEYSGSLYHFFFYRVKLKILCMTKRSSGRTLVDMYSIYRVSYSPTRFQAYRRIQDMPHTERSAMVSSMPPESVSFFLLICHTKSKTTWYSVGKQKPPACHLFLF